MSKKKIIGILLGLILCGAGIFSISFYLKIGTIPQKEKNAISINELDATLVGGEVYNNLLKEKNSLDSLFNQVSKDEINDNENITSNLLKLGNKTIYVYSIYNYNETTSFKVFEWSIEIKDGKITYYSQGNKFSNPDLIISLDSSISQQILNGNFSQDDLMNWVSNGLIKINPITELGTIQSIISVLS